MTIDKRPTLTLKSPAFTPEFRALLNKAAKKANQTQAEFVAEVLDRESRRVLTSNPSSDPADNPPPPAIVAKIEATDQKVEALAEQVRKLTELQRRSLWARITGR